MDNKFSKDDFTDNRNLQAREETHSNENPSKDVASSTHIDEALIKKTRNAWDPVYGREITDSEAIRIIERFAGIFDVLAERMGNNALIVSKPEGEVSHE